MSVLTGPSRLGSAELTQDAALWEVCEHLRVLLRWRLVITHTTNSAGNSEGCLGPLCCLKLYMKIQLFENNFLKSELLIVCPANYIERLRGVPVLATRSTPDRTLAEPWPRPPPGGPTSALGPQLAWGAAEKPLKHMVWF